MDYRLQAYPEYCITFPRIFECRGHQYRGFYVGFHECVGEWRCKGSPNMYVGEWHNRKFHGQGTMTTRAAQYVGKWKADQPHGEGTLTYASGDMHEGEWHMGKRHGKGTYTWSTGEQYVGTWVNDVCPPGSPPMEKLGWIWATVRGPSYDSVCRPRWEHVRITS
jgi:hypothetical protein